MAFGMSGMGSGISSGSDESSSSILRYLGNKGFGAQSAGIGMGSSSGIGGSFADIFAAELSPMKAINAEVHSILDRLEHDKPLVMHTPEQASDKLFESINVLLSGVHDVFASFTQTESGSSLSDLDRLLTGVKSLFDSSENPSTLEQLGDVWKKLKKQESPMFHSVHAYFLHISLSINSDDKSQYSQDTLATMISVVSTMEESEESYELQSALDIDSPDSSDELVLDSDSDSIDIT